MAYNLQFLPYSQSGLAASRVDVSRGKRLTLICDAAAALVKGGGIMKHVKKGVTLIVILMAATVGTGFAAFHMYELWYDQSNSSSDSAGAASSAVTSRGLEIQAGIDAVDGGFASKEGPPLQNRLTTFSEPTAMLLFGISLLGLAQLVRKKTVANRDREGQDQARSGSRR